VGLYSGLSGNRPHWTSFGCETPLSLFNRLRSRSFLEARPSGYGPQTGNEPASPPSAKPAVLCVTQAASFENTTTMRFDTIVVRACFDWVGSRERQEEIDVQSLWAAGASEVNNCGQTIAGSSAPCPVNV
jgi:hypothetical protein